MNLRAAAVAGMFYPSDPEDLTAMIDRFIADAGGREPTDLTGVVVPHAGYIYSGPVAAHAYRLLPQQVDRVVLLGPSHFVATESVAGSAADEWWTPLGTVPVTSIGTTDELVHRDEHSLEVQVPFLQRVLAPGWELLPLAVGHVEPSAVAELIDRAMALPGRNLLVVSTDLSHYLPYSVAVDRDRLTAAQVANRLPDAIADDDACGAYGLRGALTWARSAGQLLQQLDLRNSGDTAGRPDRVVGYGAFAIRSLVSLARASITARLAGKPPPALPTSDVGASFVTLRSASSGELLGCVGTMEAYRPLAQDVAEHALDAAFHDRRFPPLTTEQAQDMTVEVSVLQPLVEFPATGYADLVARVPVGSGLWITAPGARATYLPSVWEQLPEPADFVGSLWRKAGLRPGDWPSGLVVSTYQVREYRD